MSVMKDELGGKIVNDGSENKRAKRKKSVS